MINSWSTSNESARPHVCTKDSKMLMPLHYMYDSQSAENVNFVEFFFRILLGFLLRIMPALCTKCHFTCTNCVRGLKEEEIQLIPKGMAIKPLCGAEIQSLYHQVPQNK